MPDPIPPIRHPARFVPLSAVATGEAGQPAVPVSPDNPLPAREQPLQGARDLVPGVSISAGLALLVDCSGGGQATFAMRDGSSLTLTLSPGLTMLPLAVTQLSPVGLTASLSAWVLD